MDVADPPVTSRAFRVCSVAARGFFAAGLVLTAAAALAPGRAAAQSDFDDVEIVAHHVAGSVYYLEGRGGNIGLSVGEDGVVMIDDQFAPLPVPPAHTDGDSYIHFRASNVKHLGDVFRTTGYPFIDLENGGTLDGTIAALGVAIDMAGPDTRLIPGHGEVSTREDVTAFRDMIMDVKARVAELVEQGRTYDQVTAAAPTSGLRRAVGRPRTVPAGGLCGGWGALKRRAPEGSRARGPSLPTRRARPHWRPPPGRPTLPPRFRTTPPMPAGAEPRTARSSSEARDVVA